MSGFAEGAGRGARREQAAWLFAVGQLTAGKQARVWRGMCFAVPALSLQSECKPSDYAGCAHFRVRKERRRSSTRRGKKESTSTDPTRLALEVWEGLWGPLGGGGRRCTTHRAALLCTESLRDGLARRPHFLVPLLPARREYSTKAHADLEHISKDHSWPRAVVRRALSGEGGARCVCRRADATVPKEPGAGRRTATTQSMQLVAQMCKDVRRCRGAMAAASANGGDGGRGTNTTGRCAPRTWAGARASSHIEAVRGGATERGNVVPAAAPCRSVARRWATAAAGGRPSSCDASPDVKRERQRCIARHRAIC